MNALHSSEKKNKQTNKNKQKIRWKQNQLEQKFLVQNFQNFDIPILGDAGADSWGAMQTKRAKSVRTTGHIQEGCPLFPQVPKVLF